MNEAQRRRALDELTVWLLQQRSPLYFNREGLPAFALLVPGALAYAIGGPAELRHVADILHAFNAGDTCSAAVLLGSPEPSTS